MADELPDLDTFDDLSEVLTSDKNDRKVDDSVAFKKARSFTTSSLFTNNASVTSKQLDVVFVDSDSEHSAPELSFVPHSSSYTYRNGSQESYTGLDLVGAEFTRFGSASSNMLDDQKFTTCEEQFSSAAVSGSGIWSLNDAGSESSLAVNTQCDAETGSDVLSCTSSATTASSSAGIKRRKTSKTVDPEAKALKAAKQLEKEKKLKEKEEKRLRKEEQKRQREKVKQELEFEKTKKRLLQDALRSRRPGECMKHMTVILDTRLVSESFGPALLSCLQSNGIRYDVETQKQPNIITFWRSQAVVTETEPQKLQTTYKEIVEDEVLLYLPLTEFLQFVDNFNKEKLGLLVPATDCCTLTQFVQKKKHELGNCKLTLLVLGIDGYFRQQKAEAQRIYRNKVMQLDSDSQGAAVQKRKRKATEDKETVSVTQLIVDEALLSVQLETRSCVLFVDDDVELAKTVLRHTKAVAERPFKQERMKAAGLSIFVEGRGVRVGPDGSGLTNVWRQQLQQFKNVSVEVANAIIAKYPSPRCLFEAYKSCATEKEAETLLEDIVVRRGAGVFETVRRVGKELSRRLHTFMTNSDPDFIIT